MASTSNPDGNFNEFVVKVPKNTTKKYNVMRFSGGDQVDIQKWKGAKITRDLSGKKIFQEEEVYPEFGAGSEYGRKQKEQARKLKYGMRLSKFKIEDQPWKLSVTTTAKAPYSAKNKDKDKMVTVTKDFVGKKEGGIGEGSMYFVFMQRPDYTFEAYPVEAWYNFTRSIKHRTLTDEEAEAEWDKRDKIMNHLNFMARKRLQLDEEKEEEEEKPGNKKKNQDNTAKSSKKADNGLLIHDEPDDELLMSESDESSEDEAKKKTKKKKQKEDVEQDAPDEALEESDDGDGEGQEQDYNSDISSEEETANDSRIVPKGLDEVESSSSSEEEEEKKEGEEGADEKQKKKKKDDEMSTSGESDADSDIEKEGSALFIANKKTPTKGKKRSGSNSRSSTPNSELLNNSLTKNKLQEVAKRLETSGRTSPKVSGLLGKRHATGETSNTSDVKRQKVGTSDSGSSTPTKDMSQPHNIITEEAVRHYLKHKPITAKDLVKKFKTKKTGLTPEQTVNTVVKILKRLDLQQTKISGKIHLFLK